MTFAARRRIAHAAEVVRAGGVVAYPTEAVYGLGCLPDDPVAVQRLLDLKARPGSKGFIVIAPSVEPLLGLVALPDGTMGDTIMSSWPGPVTWVLPARVTTPPWLTGGRETLAVRVTAHPIAAELASACGGLLVSTSANRSGHPPLRSALRLRCVLGSAVDYVLPGPLGNADKPSAIRDGKTGAWLRNP